MKVFKLLLVKNRKLHSITNLGKRIRYSTKRVNVPPVGYNEYLYSFKTHYHAKEFLQIFTTHRKVQIFTTHRKEKYVIYEAKAITPVSGSLLDISRGFVCSRKLRLVKRVK